MPAGFARERMIVRTRSTFFSILALAVIAGCNPQIGTVPQNEIPKVDLATPRDSARTILMLLQAELKAIGLGDTKSLAEVRTRELEAVDREGIESSLRRMNLGGKEPAAFYVSAWASAISYYAGLIEYDAAKEVTNPNPKLTILDVPARGAKNEEVQIEVHLTQGADSRWRVTQVAFAHRPAPIIVNTSVTPAPASSPASAPHPGGG